MITENHTEKETQTDKLTTLLERLERQLQLPQISGELVSWTDGVIDLLQHAEEHLKFAVQQDHPRTYNAILKNNTELAARVEQMKTEDQDVLSAFEHLQAEAQDFGRVIANRANDERLFDPKRSRLIENGLAFILKARKQRVAVSTWMSESLRRETGVGD